MALLTTQEQKQLISTAMKQSLHVLSLPIQNLKEYLNDLATENPLVELDESYGGQTAVFQRPSVQRVEEDFSGSVFQTWRNKRSIDGEESFSVEDNAVAEESFTEYLLNQLKQDGTIPEEYVQICQFLIESLNCRGYLEDSIEDLADVMGVSRDAALQALYIIQSLSPTGVGARNLEECLILQLAEGKDFNAYTLAIVKQYLPMLAKNQIHLIAKELQLGDEEAEGYCNAIRKLNPIPSRGFYTPEDNRYVIPDAVVEVEGDKVVVQYNDRILPKININHEYCKLLKESSDPASREYLQKILGQAKKVQQDLDNRESTLVKVISYAVEMQREYISGREKTPALLTISDVADHFQMHPSTISRAVKDKYISFRGETVLLKELFHAPVNSAVDISRPAVQKHLKYLIDQEDKAAPLSDEKLKALLAEAGIDISRRTVAAYREELDIPRSSARKQKK